MPPSLEAFFEEGPLFVNAMQLYRCNSASSIHDTINSRNLPEIRGNISGAILQHLHFLKNGAFPLNPGRHGTAHEFSAIYGTSIAGNE